MNVNANERAGRIIRQIERVIKRYDGVNIDPLTINLLSTEIYRSLRRNGTIKSYNKYIREER